MDHIYISEIKGYEGKEVRLKGWLYGKRSSGKVHFLQLRDGTGMIQCVVSKADVSEEEFALAERLPQESSLMVRGDIRADRRAPTGYELMVRGLDAVQFSTDYPVGPKEHGVAFLLDKRHLWIRSTRQHAILRIRHHLIKACRDYFDSHGFTLIDAPIFTPAACEGTTTLFQTDYFEQKAYLTQSGQLYMEAGCMAFGKVYCFGPTFRSEKSKTRRHLTEFWMVEPEVAYCDLAGDMDLAEDFIESIVAHVAERAETELKSIGRDIEKLRKVRKPFPRMSYAEALELLRKEGVESQWGQDFGGDEETILSNAFDKPLIIHRYPAKCKAFYMKTDPQDERLALCVDVLAPEGHGEIIGGGQREDDLEALERKLKEHNLPAEAFDWYLDLRRYGSVPHAGFGLGIERTLGWICGLHHVREAIPFPRLMDRLKP